MLNEFKNEPYTDFTKEENRSKMESALSKVSREFGKDYTFIIDGEKVGQNRKRFNSINPSARDEVVGTFPEATDEDGETAIKVALDRFKTFQFLPPIERAGLLLRAANIMRLRRFELNAWMVYEVGKNWIEADADTAEAIDFLEFYAREIIRYSQTNSLTPIPGEFNELHYIPLGVGIIIPPWNFPLAILTGMTSAALVCGNTVIVKPSSDSPTIAYKLMEIFQEAGFPDGTVNFLTGPGSTIGNFLVAHSKTRFISFTGSKEVGLGIVELAGKTQPGQIWIKRVIAEMGGKDAIIVCEDSDIAEAVTGVRVSAFGFQGQKCSACSRLILDKKIYDGFLDRLCEEVKKIKIGPTKDYDNYLGPVINEKAHNSIMNYITIGKNEGELLTGGKSLLKETNGFFIEPTIFGRVDSKARIAQEEIFGPVLSVIPFQDYEQALQIANDTIYGLTGSVYTKDRAKIAKAKKLFHCGNLYINRKCTGALVGVHPFGGFNMSGTDSKAGGKDYLGLFLQAKSISEKL